MKFSILLLLSCTVLCLHAQQDTAIIQRQAHALTLAIESRAVYTYNILASPVVTQNDTLQIYPGETAFIEVETSGDTIKGLKAVVENTDRDAGAVVSFRQVVEKAFHQNMELKMENPFNKPLQCNTQVSVIMQQKWQYVGVITATIDKSVKTWPQIILGIKLYTWKFTK